MTHVAIIGAGPIGLDAALAAHALGLSFTVFEAGASVAQHVREWSHVRLFSPWSMNTSPRIRKALGGGVPDGPLCPTGQEFLEQVVDPVATLPYLRGNIRVNSRVTDISRQGLLKSDEIGTGRRADHSFRLLIEEAGVDRIEYADFVLDCSGSSGNPNTLGDGGIPAVGERRMAHRITRQIPDFASDPSWEGKAILLVGGGHSAQTVAVELAAVVKAAPTTRVWWALRRPEPTIEVVTDDALAGRATLGAAANAILEGGQQGIEVLGGYVVHSVAEDPGTGSDPRMRVALRGVDGDVTEVVVDRVVSLTGAVGDHTIYRQLQVHECYATSGPMSLAGALLGETSVDCLVQASHGVDVLKSPEPNFYILGAKSYGRNNTFLLRTGYDQVTEVFEEIAASAMSNPAPQTEVGAV